MRVKVLERSADQYERDRVSDIDRMPRNADPTLHPFESEREYTRALNATKLERLFAKPFLGALDGHRDGVYCMAKHPLRLNCLLTGACDGEVRVWNLATMKCRWAVPAHTRGGFVRGIAVDPMGNSFITVGDDKLVKQWRLTLGELSTEKREEADEDEDEERTTTQEDLFDARHDELFSTGDETRVPARLLTPIQSFAGRSGFLGVSHHQRQSVFATCSSVIDVWDHHRSEPMQTMSWGVDSVTSVAFNPVETSVLASTATDRSITLYDMRSSTPLRKLVLALKSNKVAWNPMEAFNFTVGNEDHNAYTFDMRRMDKALTVHKGHTGAIMDVDYNPTGTEFVTGSYDKTLRIFGSANGASRDIYHTKRMQRLFSVCWSADTRFVLCGSDETNIRLWKANASEKLGTLTPRERASRDYGDKLKERFAHHPEVRRIARHRVVPKQVRKQVTKERVMREAQRRKDDNVRKHSKPGALPYKAERKKHIVAQVD